MSHSAVHVRLFRSIYHARRPSQSLYKERPASISHTKRAKPPLTGDKHHDGRQLRVAAGGLWHIKVQALPRLG